MIRKIKEHQDKKLNFGISNLSNGEFTVIAYSKDRESLKGKKAFNMAIAVSIKTSERMFFNNRKSNCGVGKVYFNKKLNSYVKEFYFTVNEATFDPIYMFLYIYDETLVNWALSYLEQNCIKIPFLNV